MIAATPAPTHVCKGLLSPQMCRIASDYLRMRAEIGEMQLGDSQIPGSYSSYGDTLMEVLLVHLQPEVETAVGQQLLPTHSYARLYRHGEQLRPHRDRPACEFVLSLTLGHQPETCWPLYVQVGQVTEQADLAPGDGLIFPGSAVDHWREPFAGDWQAQLTLHYVARNGPLADWVFDKRPGLGRHVGTRRA